MYRFAPHTSFALAVSSPTVARNIHPTSSLESARSGYEVRGGPSASPIAAKSEGDNSKASITAFSTLSYRLAVSIQQSHWVCHHWSSASQNVVTVGTKRRAPEKNKAVSSVVSSAALVIRRSTMAATCSMRRFGHGMPPTAAATWFLAAVPAAEESPCPSSTSMKYLAIRVLYVARTSSSVHPSKANSAQPPTLNDMPGGRNRNPNALVVLYGNVEPLLNNLSRFCGRERSLPEVLRSS